MRKHIYLVAILAVAVLGIATLAKSGVLPARTAPLSFNDRWGAVDEALQTGKFIVGNDARHAR
jgi:hypothetical protein